MPLSSSQARIAVWSWRSSQRRVMLEAMWGGRWAGGAVMLRAMRRSGTRSCRLEMPHRVQFEGEVEAGPPVPSGLD